MTRQWGIPKVTSGTDLPYMKSELSIASLREWFDYDPSTGIFRRNKRSRNQVEAGAVAGTPDGKGYLRIKILGRHYLAHRLAWLWVHGEWPHLFIDHVDRDRSNNRIANLRLATASQNATNRGLRPIGENVPRIGGGVSRERFRARITIDGKNIHLGSFETEGEAWAAYERAVALHEQGLLHAS